MVNLIRRIYLYLVLQSQIVRGVFPTSADLAAAAAVTLTAGAGGAWNWGAWVQIVAAVGVTVDTQITGLTLENFTGALSQGEVEIGLGGVGAEVTRVTVPSASPDYVLVPPVFVQSGTRIAARYRTSTGAADTVDTKLITATGM